jgi:hypothetical protein
MKKHLVVALVVILLGTVLEAIDTKPLGVSQRLDRLEGAVVAAAASGKPKYHAPSTISGALDGTNVTFVLPSVADPDVLQLTYNGFVLYRDLDYTLDADGRTFHILIRSAENPYANFASPPPPGQLFAAWY